MRGVVCLLLLCLILPQTFAEEPTLPNNLTDGILLRALSQKNKPYRYNGTSPSGFDCSGFIAYVFSSYFPDIPKTSAELKSFGTSVSFAELKPGDLLLFATGKSRKQISHVALYLGQNTLIHAVSEGPRTGVILSDVNEPYWRELLVSIRRPDFPAGFPTEQGDKIYSLEYFTGSYKGTLKNALPEGRGFFFFKNGDTFVGSFKEGHAEGYGVFHWKKGTALMGVFSAGQVGEKASCLLSDGTLMAIKDFLSRNPQINLPVDGL